MDEPTLHPRVARPRPRADVSRWIEYRKRWIHGIPPQELFFKLFDRLPGVFFFAKDEQGRTMFATQGILDLYRMADETEMLGLTDFDLNPELMAKGYVDDDRKLMSGALPIVERFELWFDPMGIPEWHLVTKLPITGEDGRPKGVMGILRRVNKPEEALPLFHSVSQVAERIRKNFSSPLSMAELAARSGESARQLERKFQRAFGVSPQQFLIKTRVVAACRMLRQSDRALAYIAIECGFSDQSSFTQLFKKHTGYTPKAYRRQFNEGASPA